MEINKNKKVHAYLSKTILEVLSREATDIERIFIFSIYMQMMTMISCFLVQKQSRKVMDVILTYWMKNYSDEKYLLGKEERLNQEELNVLYVLSKK